jgi:hypothetical protein
MMVILVAVLGAVFLYLALMRFSQSMKTQSGLD